MKTDTLKKSLLDYAIKGRLSAKFRRENSGLNAFDEISTYNEATKEKRKDLEKKLKICEKELKLEKDKDKKALFKSQIQMLKKELTKCKEITPLNLSEAPFEIPSTWAWVKLGDIASLQNGYAFKTEQFSNNGIPIIKIGDIQQGKINLANCVFLNNENIDDFKDYQVVKNDILIAMSGATTGKVGIYADERLALLNQRVGLLRIENTFLRKYIFYFLTFYSADNLKQSAGSAQPNLSTQQINATFIPLPPLYEQQEIVKKLDLLVSLANDFAITKENLKRIEKRIEKSLLKLALEGSLSKLYRRSSPTLSAFDEISTYNEAIKEKRKNLEKELKKCEKEFKLEKDKDKKAFLKSQIQSLKKELTKCKEITPLFCHTTSPCHTERSEVSQNAVSLENDNAQTPPFEIPNSWAWVKLGDICEIISGEIIDLQEENLPLLDVKYLRSKGDKKLANSGNFANVNDRLILMDGENSGEIFITKEKGFLGSTLKKLEFSSLSQIEFMDFMLLCYKDFFKGNKKGAAIPHLDRKLFANLSIPLPPLKEQEYITQILDTLFTLKKGLRVD